LIAQERAAGPREQVTWRREDARRRGARAPARKRPAPREVRLADYQLDRRVVVRTGLAVDLSGQESAAGRPHVAGRHLLRPGRTASPGWRAQRLRSTRVAHLAPARRRASTAQARYCGPSVVMPQCAAGKQQVSAAPAETIRQRASARCTSLALRDTADPSASEALHERAGKHDRLGFLVKLRESAARERAAARVLSRVIGGGTASFKNLQVGGPDLGPRRRHLSTVRHRSGHQPLSVRERVGGLHGRRKDLPAHRSVVSEYRVRLIDCPPGPAGRARGPRRSSGRPVCTAACSREAGPRVPRHRIQRCLKEYPIPRWSQDVAPPRADRGDELARVEQGTCASRAVARQAAAAAATASTSGVSAAAATDAPSRSASVVGDGVRRNRREQARQPHR